MHTFCWHLAIIPTTWGVACDPAPACESGKTFPLCSHSCSTSWPWELSFGVVSSCPGLFLRSPPASAAGGLASSLGPRCPPPCPPLPLQNGSLFTSRSEEACLERMVLTCRAPHRPWAAGIPGLFYTIKTVRLDTRGQLRTLSFPPSISVTFSSSGWWQAFRYLVMSWVGDALN